MLDARWFAKNSAQYGNLVYWMDQSYTAPIAQDGPWGDVSGGYCAGLVVRWIRLAYAGKDFVGEPGYLLDEVKIRYFNGTDYQAVLYQNKLTQYFDAVKPDKISQVKYTLGLAQMLLASELMEHRNQAASGQLLTRILKQSYGCYYISLVGKGVGHAIAMRHAKSPNGKGPGVLHIFDPNNGHYAWQLQAADWPTIIDGFFRCTGYQKKYTSSYLIGRATPPIY